VFAEDPTTDFFDDIIETTGFYMRIGLRDDIRPVIDTTYVEIDVDFHIGCGQIFLAGMGTKDGGPKVYDVRGLER